ncbi:Hsp70 family protein [Nocardia sp. NPDC046763]|uniref:Hsp70 family protein n=1 Tax=Nocardia sp. NPDC046763 TaxID=3155256 RepID=UPI00340F352F
MVLVLGVSAGAAGARAMLTHSDQPHLPPIDRCKVQRRTGDRGMEDPVFEAIQQMRTSAAERDEFITGIAVTCRSATQAEAIRTAAGRNPLTVIDEPVAQLRYLRFTRKLPSEGSVLLYDLGASGLTLTQIDCRNDAVLATKRSTVLGGDGHDALLRWLLTRAGVTVDLATTRRQKEALASERVLAVCDPITGQRTVVTRSDFAELVEAGIHHSASFVRHMIDETGIQPTGMALLGGCTRNKSIRDELKQQLGYPLIYDPEPEFVSTRGAVLLAAERPSARSIRSMHLTPAATSHEAPATSPVSRRKLVAAVAVTATLGGTIVGALAMNRDGGDHTDGKPPTVEVVGPPKHG